MRSALLVGFALLGCVPPQQGSYPPPQPGPPPATGAPPGATAAAPAASCQDTLQCYGQCNPMTDACFGACDQRTTPDSAQEARALVACMAQSGCQDQACVAQQCSAQVATCTNQTLAVAPTTTAPATGDGGAGCSQQVMQPEYYVGGSLKVPPIHCVLAQADLAGEWESGTGTGQAYYDASGNYVGATTISTAEHWTIDAQGGLVDRWKGVTTSSGAAMAHGASENNTGRITVLANNTLRITRDPNEYHKDPYTQDFIVVGWFAGADEITMTLQGPFSDPPTPQDYADVTSNMYRNQDFHRKR